MTCIQALLGREFEAEGEDDNFVDLVNTAKTVLLTAYNLPQNVSLAVPKTRRSILGSDCMMKYVKRAYRPETEVILMSS